MRGTGAEASAAGARRTGWAFVSNHARVLATLDHDPSIRLRDVAVQVGITERAAQSIVADLVTAGFVTRSRVGRRNRYEVHRDAELHIGDATLVAGGLLDFLDSGCTERATVAFDDGLGPISAGNGHSSNRTNENVAQLN